MANHGMHYMSHCLNSHNTLSITPIEAALYDPLYDPLYIRSLDFGPHFQDVPLIPGPRNS